jgi:mannose-6-phosphate isomerase-like protein (cupin superfamily)
MVVGTEEVAVVAGATVVVPTGVTRGVRATSMMVFRGSLGDPASENGPH